MPPNRTSPAESFDTNLLNPGALSIPGGLQIALDSIESVCSRDDSSIMQVVLEPSCHLHGFEYIISSGFYTLAVNLSLIKCSPRFGQPTFREVIKVYRCSISHCLHPQRDGDFGHKTPPTTVFLFNPRRKGGYRETSQRAQGILKESGLVFECSEGAQ